MASVIFLRREPFRKPSESFWSCYIRVIFASLPVATLKKPETEATRPTHNRKNTNVKLTIAILTLTVAAYSQSVPNEPAAPRVKTLKVLTSEETDPSRLLPAPPKDGSDSQRRELAEVERLVKTRTPERFAQAVWDNDHEDASAFAATIGPDFDLNKLPATAKLLAVILNDQSVVASASKVYFHRKAPVAAAGDSVVSYHDWSCDKDVKKPSERGLRSYPSGHATMGYSLGIVLAALMPEKSQAILARAADYAYSREVCGDHYHSDTEASHALGSALGIMLLNNPALKPRIEASKAELLAAHLTTH
jgi:acid phosphatase (class A)